MIELGVAMAARSFRETAKELDIESRRNLRLAAQRARDTAARHAPQRLRNTLRLRQGGPFEARVESTSPHAGFSEFGTKAHTIRPKRGSMLRFIVNGQVVFARGVRHPGQKAVGFMRKGREAGERMLVVFASGLLR
jgi:hypothetical protein